MKTIARCAATAAISFCFLFASACQQPKADIKPPRSSMLPMKGQSEGDVIRALGAPDEVRTSNFEPPRNGEPIPFETDRQLIIHKSMSRALVFLSKGKVVSAVLEWSDY